METILGFTKTPPCSVSPSRARGQSDVVSGRSLSTQPTHSTPPLYHLEAGPFPAATSANHRARPAKRSTNEQLSNKPSSCTLTESLYCACANSSGLLGVEVSFWLTKARGQKPRREKNKRMKTEERPPSQRRIYSTFFFWKTPQIKSRRMPYFSLHPTRLFRVCLCQT